MLDDPQGFKLKKKKQPELTKNWTVWKSDNQGVKEETFIQTGRRGGDASRAERTHGRVEAGGLSEVVAGGVGGPTFACK